MGIGALTIDFSWMKQWPHAVVRLIANHLALKLGLRGAESVLRRGHTGRSLSPYFMRLFPNVVKERKTQANLYRHIVGRSDFIHAACACEHKLETAPNSISPSLAGLKWCTNRSRIHTSSVASDFWTDWNSSLTQQWRFARLVSSADISSF